MIKFENKSNGRFYYLLVEKDLLNNCVLRILYGGRNISRSRSVCVSSSSIMQTEIERITKKRLKRGYTLVT